MTVKGNLKSGRGCEGYSPGAEGGSQTCSPCKGRKALGCGAVFGGQLGSEPVGTVGVRPRERQIAVPEGMAHRGVLLEGS